MGDWFGVNCVFCIAVGAVGVLATCGAGFVRWVGVAVQSYRGEGDPELAFGLPDGRHQKDQILIGGDDCLDIIQVVVVVFIQWNRKLSFGIIRYITYFMYWEFYNFVHVHITIQRFV